MKSKNLILGLLAFVFAVSTAFTTTKLVTEDAYVVVRLDDEDGPIVCRNTGGQCNADGYYLCKVKVTCWNCIPQGYKIVTPLKTGCTEPLLSLKMDSQPIQYDGYPEVIYDVCETCY